MPVTAEEQRNCVVVHSKEIYETIHNEMNGVGLDLTNKQHMDTKEYADGITSPVKDTLVGSSFGTAKVETGTAAEPIVPAPQDGENVDFHANLGDQPNLLRYIVRAAIFNDVHSTYMADYNVANNLTQVDERFANAVDEVLKSRLWPGLSPVQASESGRVAPLLQQAVRDGLMWTERLVRILKYLYNKQSMMGGSTTDRVQRHTRAGLRTNKKDETVWPAATQGQVVLWLTQFEQDRPSNKIMQPEEYGERAGGEYNAASVHDRKETMPMRPVRGGRRHRRTQARHNPRGQMAKVAAARNSPTMIPAVTMNNPSHILETATRLWSHVVSLVTNTPSLLVRLLRQDTHHMTAFWRYVVIESGYILEKNHERVQRPALRLVQRVNDIETDVCTMACAIDRFIPGKDTTRWFHDASSNKK
jgi:hypothetical protein